MPTTPVDLASPPPDSRPALAALDCVWRDEAELAQWAQQFAQQAAPVPGLIALHGPLGAGKTTFARHLLRALGVGGRIKSPTYAVLEPYTLADGRLLRHLDAYRLADAREAEESGLREAFDGAGLTLVEWPERLGGWMPTPDWRLHLQAEPLAQAPEARRVRLQAHTPRGLGWLRAMGQV